MAVIPVYLELMQALCGNDPILPNLSVTARNCLGALEQTYGAALFGPGGLEATLVGQRTHLSQALGPAPNLGLEALVEHSLAGVAPLLPGAKAPDVYLSTLVFTAPAATLCMAGNPTIVLGMERFSPEADSLNPGRGRPPHWFHPDQVVEMVPHEAAHVVRMQALDLPLTPRQLSLLEMVMLEGTALCFTDDLLRRKTLESFLPARAITQHRANERQMRHAVLTRMHQIGMAAFTAFFASDSPISGYYVGQSLCREYLRRNPGTSSANLLTLPSQVILTGALGPHPNKVHP